MTKIHLPCINSLPEYVLSVPLEAVHLIGTLQVTLLNTAGEDLETSFILTEKIKRETDEATPIHDKGMLLDQISMNANEKTS